MKNNIKKNFIWNSIGITINSFNSLFFLIIVKWINGIDVAGIFTYSFSLCMLSYVISNYYNRAYQVTNHNKHKFSDYLIFRIITSIIALVVTMTYSILSNFEFDKIIVILLLLLFRIIESISDCFYALFQDNDRLYKVGISYTLKGIIGLFLFFIVDLVFNNVFISIISLIIINVIVLMVYDFNNMKKITKFNFKFNGTAIKSIFFSSFSIFIFSFLSMFLSNISKYILTYFADNSVQTILGILLMPATMVSLVGSYIIMPFLSKFKELNNKGDDKAIKVFSIKILFVLLLIDVICCIVGYFIGIPILNIIYNINLNEYKTLLMIIIFGAFFCASSNILSNILTVQNNNNKQLIIHVVTTFISLAISIILIKNMIITGAVYSYFITYLVLFVLYIGLLFTTKKGDKNEKK